MDKPLAAGFRRIGAEIDGWLNPEKLQESEGRVFGTIVEHRTVEIGDDQKRALIVRLLDEATAVKGAGSSKEVVILQAGDHMAVVSSAKLEILFSLPLETVVIIEPVERIRLKGGRTMWVYDLQVKEPETDSDSDSD